MKSKTKATQNEQAKCSYDDGNRPNVDLPGGEASAKSVEPLPESCRPIKDGPGGD